MFWKPTQAVVSDVAHVLTSLAEGLTGYKCDSEWLADLRQRDDDKETANRFLLHRHLVLSFSLSRPSAGFLKIQMD